MGIYEDMALCEDFGPYLIRIGVMRSCSCVFHVQFHSPPMSYSEPGPAA